MKSLFVLFFLFSWLVTGIGCRQDTGGDRPEQRRGVTGGDGGKDDPGGYWQVRVDSLTALVRALTPGLGEFMVQLKYHHDRLAEAVSAKDFERSAYEIDELKETAEKIQLLRITNEKLQEPFPVFYQKYLQAPLESLAASAQQKDLRALKTNLEALTSNCNSCHHENNVAFMHISNTSP
ncbi:MAG: hypothetical protein P4L51_25885 [Puia sp.]|nr:hypothetical protein [Puia sp.]